MVFRKRELQEGLCGEALGVGGATAVHVNALEQTARKGSRTARCTGRFCREIAWNMTHHPLLDAALGIPIRSRFASGSRISISYPQGASSTSTPNSFAIG